MDGSTFAAVAAVAAVILIAVLFLLIGTGRNVRKDLARMRRKHPKRSSGDLCGICFGTISNDDMIARCACGQTFHDACARPTEACPYCERPYPELTVESPDCIKCPSCGKDVVGNVCVCGAVVNRGGFTCGCGNSLDVNDPVCKRCGKKYEVRSGRDNRGR